MSQMPTGRGARLDGADLRQTDLATAVHGDEPTRPPDPFTDTPAPSQDSWEQLMKSLATRAKDKG